MLWGVLCACTRGSDMLAGVVHHQGLGFCTRSLQIRTQRGRFRGGRPCHGLQLSCCYAKMHHYCHTSAIFGTRGRNHADTFSFSWRGQTRPISAQPGLLDCIFYALSDVWMQLCVIAAPPIELAYAHGATWQWWLKCFCHVAEAH